MNKTTKIGIASCACIVALATGSPLRAQEPEVQEAAPPQRDMRVPVALRPNERAAMLQDMREYLKGLQDIFASLAKDDMDAVAARATSLGKINIYETHLMFPKAAGVKFRELSALVHDDFDEIANEAKGKRNVKATLLRLSATMKRCTSCHESFRLSDYGP
jgi:cytochrome c556